MLSPNMYSLYEAHGHLQTNVIARVPSFTILVTKAVLVPLIGEDRVVIVKLDHQDVEDKERISQLVVVFSKSMSHIELRLLIHFVAVAEAPIYKIS